MKPPFGDEILGVIEVRLAWLRHNAQRLTIDGDAHVSAPVLWPPHLAERVWAEPNYFHGRPISAPELIAEMDMAGVDCALIWQNPAATARGSDIAANYESLYLANKYIHDSALNYPERLIPAGWTDPAGLGTAGALRMAEECVTRFGFAIVKMNPAQNQFPIDSAISLQVAERICELGAIPAFHVGGDTKFTPASGLEKIARHLAPHRVIAVHMGGGGSGYTEGETLYHEIRQLGLKMPNLFFIQSAKRDTHIESDFITYEAAGAPFNANIAVGSDAPYGRVSWNFGGYRAMFGSLADVRHPDPRLKREQNLFPPAAVRRYLGRNLAELLIEAHEGILGER